MKSENILIPRFHLQSYDSLRLYNKYTCFRCGARFLSSETNSECRFHPGRYDRHSCMISIKLVLPMYDCCNKAVTAPPCCFNNMHVYEKGFDISKFVNTSSWPKTPTTESIVSIDCEMCLTDEGRAVVRVSVVNCKLMTIYDTYVKPTSRVRDYNTLYTGITEKDLIGCTKTLTDIHRDLSKIISAETILICHSPEHDFLALKVFSIVSKIVHLKVVSTSLVFSDNIFRGRRLRLRVVVENVLRKKIQREHFMNSQVLEVIAALKTLYPVWN
ncbi:RNA exonuclease 1 [Thelohanellus kitauei]|uniref:RNA exonuclease 1 n=1 Tax=Thelohanellus kitauei TaxID=669202 RepID=A0A0C2IWX2_THEKT|nr:RNA exonuclease 1 [Thelohanellus kitauei]